MALRAKEVSEQLTLRQWSVVCTAVDHRTGLRTKFDVVSIKKEKEVVSVLVCIEGGILHTVELAA